MSKIIVALDGMGYGELYEIAKKLSGHVWGFKINDVGFFYGARAIVDLAQFGNVMLDMKWHDIPNTVRNVAKKFKEHPIAVATVHASGGIDMMQEAVKILGDRVAAVTALTSLSEMDCMELFGRDNHDAVGMLERKAKEAGCEYVVCSPLELKYLGYGMKPIVPGIRPLWFQEKGDQKRVATPAEAIDAGAELLVMGRPILTGDPVENAKRTNDEIGT